MPGKDIELTNLLHLNGRNAQINSEDAWRTALVSDSYLSESDTNTDTTDTPSLSRGERARLVDRLLDADDQYDVNENERCFTFWRKVKEYKHYVRFTLKEFDRRRFNYCVGFSSIFLVVLIVACAETTLLYSPIIFLSLSENQHGQIDISMSADSHRPHLNFTQIYKRLSDAGDEFTYISPRYTVPITLSPFKLCDASVLSMDPFDKTWYYEEQTSVQGSCVKKYHTPQRWELVNKCLRQACPYYRATNMVLFDTAREARMGVGRTWEHPPLNEGEMVMTEGTAAELGLTQNDVIIVEVDTFGFFLSLGVFNFKHKVSEIWDDTNFQLSQATHVPFVLKYLIPDPKGKMPKSSTREVWAEYSQFLPYLHKYLNPVVEGVPDRLAAIKLDEHAHQILVNAPPDRILPYMSNDYRHIQSELVPWANRLIYKLGFSQIDSSMPVLWGLWGTRLFSIFLGLILNLIVTVLTFLSTLLIYSLLMVNVETRTFELGVYRMVGMQRNGLIELMMVQAALYAFPAWSIGLSVSQLLQLGITDYFVAATEVPISNLLSAPAILKATALGLLIPTVSSIIPIKSALEVNIHAALDTVHAKVKAVAFTIERATGDEFSTVGCDGRAC
eukprot:GFYU01031884.1.p1 GENE.GFYU01031884.1~~GFYU01031884.1.p1  ORF type:complete len:616 (-),score=122.39 GFYU01031884.1:840-2687(-)